MNGILIESEKVSVNATGECNEYNITGADSTVEL